MSARDAIIFILLFANLNAFGADSSPTVSDAHEFFRDQLARRVIQPYPDAPSSVVYVRYSGNSCDSIFSTDRTDYSLKWALVSSVAKFNNDVWIRGPVDYLNLSGRPRHMVELLLRAPDQVTGNRLEKAAKLLFDACTKKSKFD